MVDSSQSQQNAFEGNNVFHSFDHDEADVRLWKDWRGNFCPYLTLFDCKTSRNFSHRGSGRCGKNPHFSFLKASLISSHIIYERNNSATASFFDVDCSFCTYSRPYALLICVSDLNCIHWSYNSPPFNFSSNLKQHNGRFLACWQGEVSPRDPMSSMFDHSSRCSYSPVWSRSHYLYPL